MYLANSKFAEEHPNLAAIRGIKPLDSRVASATLIDPYLSNLSLDSLGDWAGDHGINVKVFDTPGDGVGGCTNDSIYCEHIPDYSVGLDGKQRTTDLAPIGTRNPLDQSSQNLHGYTFSHVAKQTQDWLRIVWR